MSRASAPDPYRWAGYPECPCEERCGATGTKLLAKSDHVPDCRCRRCTGSRNRREGRATELRRHQRLGANRHAPADELATSYSINVTTQDKGGEQIPASFRELVASAWFRHALRQAEAKMAIGFDAMPAVYVEPPGGGSWLIVKVPARGLR